MPKPYLGEDGLHKEEGVTIIYLISYDLNKPLQDYEGLISSIKSLGPCIEVLKSQWLVQSNNTAEQIFKALDKFLDSNDRILVNELTLNNYGHWDTEVWDWLTKHPIS